MELLALPDNLLLEVFSYLLLKDRCIIGRCLALAMILLNNYTEQQKKLYRVCRRLRRIANDNSLWRHVDLLPYRLDLKKTWKVIRSHLSECLLSFKLRGYMDRKEPNGTRTVSDAMLEDLQGRCPNITELHLHLVYINQLTTSKLPRTLTSLHLTRCSWAVSWMNNVELPDLRCLNVTKTTAVENRDISDFVKFTNLEELSLNGCYRVKESGINNIAENLTGLFVLDLSDTDCTDLNLHHIGRSLKHLSKLCLASCTKITNAGVVCIAEGLKNLQYLDISNCRAITDSCLSSLFKLKCLQTLKHTLNTTNLNEEDLERLNSYQKNETCTWT